MADIQWHLQELTKDVKNLGKANFFKVKRCPFSSEDTVSRTYRVNVNHIQYITRGCNCRYRMETLKENRVISDELCNNAICICFPDSDQIVCDPREMDNIFYEKGIL
jgi:hypothetical protein